MAALATASRDAAPDQPVDASLIPSQLLTLELLRRPLEFAQYIAIRFTEALIEAGIAPSVGTVGDALDNAMAESVIGLYKAECVRHEGPWHGVDDLELATMSWVWWFNETRLHGELGHVPPIEYEAAYYRQINSHQRLLLGEPSLH